MFSPRENAIRTRHFSRLADTAPVIVFSSRAAEEDYGKFYRASRADTYVLRFATFLDESVFQGDPLLIQRKYALPDRFFLVSNQFWKHKNHRVVVDALDILASKGVRPHVVCTGNFVDYRNPGYFSELVEHIERRGLRGQIHILGLIPRLEQLQLMRRCVAVVQPSRFEGWSTVVEDAKALDRPLLLSDLPVHREQSPRDVSFFSCGDAPRLAELFEVAAEWSPGPDLGREPSAYESAQRRMCEVGSAFLTLAGRQGVI
jgi:glycosyltransferase involved in cell wall biosynthesis